mmetsp:Transcript_6982/g.14307  ORF Transcript_6982/g.14307 Transcript_6982/m.14307 type:complete len:192 (+) Transcript_6982:618-1193(+)|eukprot:CAMPEP_0168761028 /NCGR_PEP_ID=MMETSP0724-20121128/23082_1 /TAXON_ID=265536 /ORGANISM="Amphiprora sp., Strain CCMP467" /LENGTH=191 /DNA_ID=CAMNT_0008810079 /DNA_START=394 /DNA_END=969 /DNA_ORIENTATION=-
MSQDPLMSAADDPASIPLYDPQAMLHMEKAIAQGFMTLLCGGDPQPIKNLRKNRIRRSAVDMGFAAITDGNVLEACFGLPASSIILRDGHPQAPSLSQRAKQTAAQVRRTKILLDDAADVNPGLSKLAVGTYLRAFDIVISTRDQMDQLNILTRCFFKGKIVHKALGDLRVNFARLQEAILQSSVDAGGAE